MSHLAREIQAQPEVLERLLRTETPHLEKLAARIRRARPRVIFLVARGTSDNAGLYGKYLFGARNQQVVALAAPSLFTLYRRPPDLSGCLVLAISQSGTSDDLCQVAAEGRRQGALTVVVTNAPAAPLARLADEVVCLHAGPERSVAATKTYTAQLAALAMLSLALDPDRRGQQALRRVPEKIAAVLRASGNLAVQAERYRYANRMSVIGRGYNYATAFELSLKLKELAYLSAESASSADFRHGPIAMIEPGFPVLLVAPQGRTLKDLRELAQALRARGAELLVISQDRALLRVAHTSLRLPGALPEWLSPLVAVVPGQLLALQLARARGCPLDRPRGLSKVTRTT